LRKTNIVLITIDSLRKDFVSTYNEKIGLTPFIKKMSKYGMVFNKAYSIGPNTPHAMPGIINASFSSMYEKGYHLKKHSPTIAEFLKEHGYYTIGVTNGNIYVSRFYGYNRGFDVFLDFIENKKISRENKNRESFKRVLLEYILEKFPKAYRFIIKNGYRLLNKGSNESNFPYTEASIANKYIKELLSSNNLYKPFFLWIHYNDVHVPYRITSNYDVNLQFALRRLAGMYQWKNLKGKRLLSQKDIEIYKKMYSEGVKYIDEKIKDIYEFIVNNFQNNVFIVTSDHGDEFFEKGDFEHKSKLIPELLEVPLILSGDITANFIEKYSSRLDKPISTIDIFDFVTDLINVQEIKDLPKNLISKSNLFFQCYHIGNDIPPQISLRKYKKVFRKIAYLKGEKIIVWDEMQREKNYDERISNFIKICNRTNLKAKL